MPARVLALIQDFEHQPVLASGELRQWLDADRAGFISEAIETLPHVADGPGSLHVLRAICADADALQTLTNPAALSEEAAIGLARRLQAVEPFLDARLLDLLDGLAGWHASRVLQIVAAISDGKRIMSPLAKLLRHQDARVRSKAALLIGQSNGNLWWVEQQMAESDARVRANAVQSLWGTQSRQACALFRAACADPSHRVAANAVVGLYRAGDQRLSRALESMVSSGDEWCRAAAAWAMGETRDPRYVRVLAQFIRESTGAVRQNAIRAMVRVRKRLQELQQQPPLRIWADLMGSRIEVRLRPWIPALPPMAFLVRQGDTEVGITSVQCRGVDDAFYELYIVNPPDGELTVSVCSESGLGQQVVRRGVD